MKIGSSFNPPHLGHAAAARAAREVLKLDTLYLIPAGTPPHKALPPGTPSGAARMELARTAAETLGDRVEVLDWEIRREGKSYTADTLEAVRAAHPGDTLWFLMGSDMFLTLHRWYQPEKILSLAGIAAFRRSRGEAAERMEAQRRLLCRTWPQARIFLLDIPDDVDVSSTEVRAALAAGGGGEWLHPEVYGRVLREGLYGTAADLRHLTLEQLRPVALSHLKHRRVPHVLGTEQEAVRMAVRYGVDEEPVRRAALLHDCTKRLSTEEQFALCDRYGLRLDEQERRNPQLLHAITGAAVARDVYGESEQTVNAIRWHTTGRPGMTAPEKIMYLADLIEPSRDFPGVEELRARCYEDLDGGLRLALERTVRYVRERGGVVHQAALDALEALRGSR